MEINSTRPLRSRIVGRGASVREGENHQTSKASKTRAGRVAVSLTVACVALLATRGVAHATTNEILFCDYFAASSTPNLPAPWAIQSGDWTVSDGKFCGEPSSLFSYGFTCVATNWTDYSVQGQIRFPAHAYGGGLGGRLNPTTGAHYAAWVYPEGSVGGSNLLRLVKFTSWETWTSLKQVRLPAVGTDTHTLKLSFSGNRITAHFDGFEVASVTDDSFASGGITADMWTHDTPYVFSLDDVIVTSLPQSQTNNSSALPPLTISTIQKLPDGNMRLVANGNPGQIYHLQASGELGNPWSNLATNAANGSGVIEFNDLGATNHSSRFYRIFTP